MTNPADCSSLFPAPWHLGVHHLGELVVPERTVTLRGEQVQTLVLEPWQQSLEFSVSFDDVLSAIGGWPGGYVEGDGSWVWRPKPGPEGSFIEGNLFDGQVNLRHVELKGKLKRGELKQLLELLAGGSTRLAIQWVSEGLFLDAQAFLAAIDE